MRNAKQINIKHYNFNLPKEYQTDIWDVTNLEIYKKASKKNKRLWDQHAIKTKSMLDFTPCDNIIVREELKYCVYFVINKGTTLWTLIEKSRQLRHFMNFANIYHLNSLCDVTTAILKEYLNKYTNISSEKVIHKYETTLIYYQELIDDYFNYFGNKNKYDNDIWRAKYFVDDINELTTCRNINFGAIKKPEFRQEVKDFCKFHIQSTSFATCYRYVLMLTDFFEWLDIKYSKITHLNSLTRLIIEEYISWLRLYSGYSKNKYNSYIDKLRKFLEIGKLINPDVFPEENLIIYTDTSKKTNKESEYFTDDELKDIIRILHTMPKVFAKITFAYMEIGCRTNELLFLKPEQIKIYEDGTYYLALYQTKTKHEYEKPISNNLATLLLSEIDYNKKRFGDNIKYVFLTDKNKPFCQSVVRKAMQKAIKENNVLDRDGNLLHITPKRFRHTLTTNLFRQGFDALEVSLLMGKRGISSLAYYAAVVPEEIKSKLRDRIQYDEYLITHIGKFEQEFAPPTPDAIPLCNGWCTKPHQTGVCKKANYCLKCKLFVPTFEHINTYKNELRELESTITIAKQENSEILLQKCMEDKKALEKIITELEERMKNNE